MRLLSIVLLGCAVRSIFAQAPSDSSISRFYEDRWFRSAWIQANALTHNGEALLDVLSQADREGLESAEYVTPALDSLLHRHLLPDEAWQLDTLLTAAFLTYARDVSQGRVAPELVDSQWTAAAHPFDAVGLLESALDGQRVGTVLDRLAPPQSGYAALRAALSRYRELAQRGGWPAPLGLRLASEGYDTTAGLDAAIRQFQTLHGLTPDGVVGPVTRGALNVSPAIRAQQIILNLERWRWTPRRLGERYIIVNSAAFVLELVERDTVRFTSRAVVGRTDWPTPITSSRATDIVFRPVWKVPRLIAIKELVPLIQRDSSYLHRNGFRVFSDTSLGVELNPRRIKWKAVTESTFAYQLAQEPGPENPLGGMKLVFWTPFGVFIHDTPLKPAFTERWRTFSHGCVRIEDAAGLAALLLPDWPADSIHEAMREGGRRQRWVRLPRTIPVHLVYWTAWVTDDGMVAFAGDPYGWDVELRRALETRNAPRFTLKGETAP